MSIIRSTRAIVSNSTKIPTNLISILLLFVLFGLSCSTEKDAALNKGYHNMTARYNGYFNAGVIIQQSLDSYREKYVDDYNKILPLKVYPSEEDASSVYPQMDDAIERCSKVIYRHSMPNPNQVKNKDEENCRWIDDNWLVIGKAHYIKREYGEAQEKLLFVATNPQYNGEEAVFEAKIWLAKTYIAQGNFAEATRVMKEVEVAKEAAESRRNRTFKEKMEEWKDKRTKKKKNRKKGKKNKKGEKEAEFPKRLVSEYEATMAELYIAEGDYKKAIPHLEAAIDACRNKKEKARYMFVLAQLHQEQGNTYQAIYYYKKVSRSSAPYVMQFKAKINKALVATSGGEALRKELRKMLKDGKNAEYKDQIYYALAEIEYKDGNMDEAKRNYTQSAIWSVNNNRQKGLSYLKLADIYYGEKDYLKAQKYYDSSVTALPEDFDNYTQIQAKAEGLSDLVFHYETYTFEDSVQQFVDLDEKALRKRMKEIADQLAEEERIRKAEEEKRLLAMQDRLNSTASNNNNGGNVSKWYWNNPKLVSNGVNEFRTQWGQREDEDNWRRSNKSSVMVDGDDSEVLDSAVVDQDSLAIELLLANIPLSPEALDSSNNRLMNSLYMLGIIYKEQLKEENEAIVYFEKVINRGIDHHKVLPAMYQLHLIYKKRGDSKAGNYKDRILTDYPNSEIAQILKDPDYLKKKEEQDKIDINKYKETYHLYISRYYNRTIAACNSVINKDPDNQFIRKYYMLKAFAISKLNPGAIEAISSPLQTLVKDYPDSEEGKQAKTYLGKLGNGETITDQGVDAGYTYDTTIQHFFILLYPTMGGPEQPTKIKISNFNNTFFGSKGYTVNSMPLDGKTQLIIVKSFPSLIEGKKYIDAYGTSSSTSVLGTAQTEYEYYLISADNFSKLVKSKKLQEYKDFYGQTYD